MEDLSSNTPKPVDDQSAALSLSQEALQLYGGDNVTEDIDITDLDDKSESVLVGEEANPPTDLNPTIIKKKRKRNKKKKKDELPTNSTNTLKLVQAFDSPLVPQVPSEQAVPQPGTSRNRSRSRKTLAKSSAKTPKRPRETGFTPPSVEQITKRTLQRNESIGAPSTNISGQSIATGSSLGTPGLNKSVSNRLNELKHNSRLLNMSAGGTPDLTINSDNQSTGLSSDYEIAGTSIGSTTAIAGTPNPSAQMMDWSNVPSTSVVTTNIGSGTTTLAGNQKACGNVTKNVNKGGSSSSQKPAGSYASVAGEQLLLAIADMKGSDEVTLLTGKKFDTLQSRLNAMVIEQIGKVKSLPGFDDTRLISGVMRIQCRDLLSRTWLERNVPKMTNDQLWSGANLKVFEFSKVPKPFKYKVWLPGTQKLRTREIFKLIEGLNKGVLTHGWSVVHRQVMQGGSTMVIGVDADAINVITSRNGELYCGIGGKAKFTLQSKPPPPQVPQTVTEPLDPDPGQANMGPVPMDEA